ALPIWVGRGGGVHEGRVHAGFDHLLDRGGPPLDPVGLAEAAQPLSVTGAQVEVDPGVGGEHRQVGLLRDVAEPDHGDSHASSVAFSASSRGVGVTPKVCWKAEESRMYGATNW